jgi:hypothetical protein
MLLLAQSTPALPTALQQLSETPGPRKDKGKRRCQTDESDLSFKRTRLLDVDAGLRQAHAEYTLTRLRSNIIQSVMNISGVTKDVVEQAICIRENKRNVRHVFFNCWACECSIQVSVINKIKGPVADVNLYRKHFKAKHSKGEQPGTINVPETTSVALPTFQCAGLSTDLVSAYCRTTYKPYGGCEDIRVISARLFETTKFNSLSEEQMMKVLDEESLSRMWSIVGLTVFSVNCLKNTVRSGSSCIQCLGLVKIDAFQNMMRKTYQKLKRLPQVKYINKSTLRIQQLRKRV